MHSHIYGIIHSHATSSLSHFSASSQNSHFVLLINKFDSDIIYKFDGVGKIIIDNINNGKTETIKI